MRLSTFTVSDQLKSDWLADDATAVLAGIPTAAHAATQVPQAELRFE